MSWQQYITYMWPILASNLFSFSITIVVSWLKFTKSILLESGLFLMEIINAIIVLSSVTIKTSLHFPTLTALQITEN